jgi:hypothetical protein
VDYPHNPATTNNAVGVHSVLRPFSERRVISLAIRPSTYAMMAIIDGTRLPDLSVNQAKGKLMAIIFRFDYLGFTWFY